MPARTPRSVHDVRVAFRSSLNLATKITVSNNQPIRGMLARIAGSMAPSPMWLCSAQYNCGDWLNCDV